MNPRGTILRPLLACLLGVMTPALALLGCGVSRPAGPPLNEIYSEAAQKIGAERNPVVVIPGVLGSKLVERETHQIVWGAFTYGAADADYPDGARLFALPMSEGVPLSELRDTVEPDGVLESLEANVSVFKITALEPYLGIIQTLAAGRFVDRDIARAQARTAIAGAAPGPVDYAGLHYTCFQFDYDWRCDISESAIRLDQLVRSAAEATQRARGTDAPVKVDVVAHSMGGVVLMYYLRYGIQPLPDDGSLPPETWAGAANIEQAILVGTPSAGSVLSLKQLVEGAYYSPIAPEYRPAIVGTMPAIYALLPRDRHNRVVDADTGEAVPLFDVATWKKYRWGLADPAQDKYLAWLLPDVSDPAVRRRIALDHLCKCLARTEQLHRALDRPMNAESLPRSTTISLVLGDSERTPSVLAVNPRTGRLTIREQAPGDGTVTRSSALMDERVGGPFRARLDSPVRWTQVQFIAADHLALTQHPAFVDALLYNLLEKPRSADQPVTPTSHASSHGSLVRPGDANVPTLMKEIQP